MQRGFPSFTQLVQRGLNLSSSLVFHDIFLEGGGVVMHQRVRYQTWRITLRHVREENQTDAEPSLFAFLVSPRGRKKKWERFRSDSGAKMIVFSDVLWPRRSPQWRWQRHSGIGCGHAWQASKASALFLPGRPGTASQPATLQQPPN